MITASPGHYGPKTGAQGLIDEVTEAIKVTKRVTSILRAAGITTNYIEDNVSKSQSQNIPWLIAQHNKTNRQIDVSIHFNSTAGTHSRGIGTETLIHNGKNIDTATAITDAISKVSGLKNRGVKIRPDLGLLKGTNKPCYLIEVCFVNDSVDVAIYLRDFEKICQAIAEQLAKAVGKTISTKVEGKTKEESPVTKETYEKDAAPATWAEDAVEWAKENGVSDGTYLKRPATREEVITMIYKSQK
ncbi:N-acetylmuramoyl-L-alanine amidase [Solibacillus sp. FSL R7-0682]|uniref:N-acetylmuramoyl-L-alanine amidase n=1 Tax=Solibacillus sp. FSL R7-0682 TaxID=2921690 RepID=UPI0030F97BB0